MDHIKLAAELGFLTARAKFAAENPELADKLQIWSSLSKDQKKLLLGEIVYPDTNSGGNS